MINFNMSFDDALAELNASVDIPVVAASGSGSGRFSRPVGNYRKDRLTNIYWPNGLLLYLGKEMIYSQISSPRGGIRAVPGRSRKRSQAAPRSVQTEQHLQ